MAAAAASVFMLGQLVLAVPVGAVTGPTTVTADQQSAVPAGRLWGFNDFFPRTVTVQTGTDIQFNNQGFHTFTVLAAGTSAWQDEHANGLALDDTDDTGLNPNGTTHAELNQPALNPTSLTCGSAATPCAFDGHSVVSSGAPAGPPAPFFVHVSAAPGTYVFVCRIHAGMTGKLKVVAADAPVPTQAQVDKQVAKQVKHDLAGAWAADRAAEHETAKLNETSFWAAWRAKHDAVKRDRDGGWVADLKAEHDAFWHHWKSSRTLFVIAGTSSRDGKVALLEFFPRNLDARPGDKVLFVPKSPNEPHTVTFPGDLGTEFVPFCEAGATDTAMGPTGCNFGPPDELELDGGNGVWHVTQPGAAGTVSDSGIIASPRLAKAFGAAKTDVLNHWKISLAGAAPGTYTYVCQIHDGMEATITVH